MATAGYLLYQHGGLEQFDTLLTHPSDTVRGWAAYLLASLPELSLGEQLERIRPLADDKHFSVREWAWIAIRPPVAANLDEAVELLTPWTTEESPNLRRFASEITRPRGVWCAHIKELKENPKRGLPLLNPLSSDSHRYVQDSVANWLNDAGKSNPGWVLKVCRGWQRKSRSKATARICKRACRNITTM